jgi:hypothetical protein
MGYRKYTEEFKREVLTMVAEGSRSVDLLDAQGHIVVCACKVVVAILIDRDSECSHFYIFLISYFAKIYRTPQNWMPPR